MQSGIDIKARLGREKDGKHKQPPGITPTKIHRHEQLDSDNRDHRHYFSGPSIHKMQYPSIGKQLHPLVPTLNRRPFFHFC